MVETFEQQRPTAEAVIPEVHELPPSKVFQTDFIARGSRVELAGPDEEEIRQKVDRAQARDQRLVVIGIPRDLSAKPDLDGTWEQVNVQQGARVWAFSVVSKEATSIRVHFKDVALPEGAKLYIYAPEFPEEAQVIVGKGPFDKGEFWSALIPGETVAIELLDTEARAASERPAYFQIDQVSHLFKDAIGPLNTAGSCNLDASCYSAWTASGNSVGRIIGTNGDTFACSGTLISDQASDKSPLFLTATHCFQSDYVANTAIVFWMFKTSSCNGSTPSIYSTPQTIGASMVSQGQPDTTLLLLTGTVPANIPFAGWTNADPAHAAAITALHHPRGSWRRISFGTKQNDDYYYPDYHQVRWSSGITEPGSSGSPAFNANHQITGTLSLGSSTCSNRDGSDYYSKLSLAYQDLNADGVLVSGLPDTDRFGSHKTRQTAASLTLPFQSTTLAAKVGTDDWYKMTLSPGAKMVIHFQSITPSQAAAYFSLYIGNEPYPMSLYADPGSYSLYSVRNGNSNPTDYYIQVKIAGGAYVHYTMSVDYFLAGPPTVSLGSIYHLYADSVSPEAWVETSGVDTIYWYEYATENSLNNPQTIAQSTLYAPGPYTPAWQSTNQQVIGYLSGLQSDTTYYYRVRARNAYGEAASPIGTFHTDVATHEVLMTPQSLQFGAIPVGTSLTRDIYLTNMGNVKIRLDNISITGEGFSTNLGTISCTLNARTTCMFSVTYKPTTEGPRNGMLTITDGSNSYNLPLSGDAQVAPVLSIDHILSPYWGQQVWVGQWVSITVPISNIGSAPLTISQISLNGSASNIITLGDCSTVEPGVTCNVTFQFTVTSTPWSAGFVYIYSNSSSPNPVSWYWSLMTTDLTLNLSRPARSDRSTLPNSQPGLDKKLQLSQEAQEQEVKISPTAGHDAFPHLSILPSREGENAEPDKAKVP